MNKFTDLRRSLGPKLAVFAVVAMIPTLAHADLIGDEVTSAIVGGPGAFKITPPSAIVGPGVEFVIDFLGTPSHEVDIGSVSMHVYSVFGSRISTGAGEVLVLGDLDSSVPGQTIVGITNFDTNEPEYTIADVTFTDFEVRFNMGHNIWEVNGYVKWDVVFGGASGMVLAQTGGTCGSSRVTLSVTDCTPGNRIAMAYGMADGLTGIPMCPGVSVDINRARNAGVRRASGGGVATFSGNVPAGVCARIRTQAADIDDCTTSNKLTGLN